MKDDLNFDRFFGKDLHYPDPRVAVLRDERDAARTALVAARRELDRLRERNRQLIEWLEAKGITVVE